MTVICACASSDAAHAAPPPPPEADHIVFDGQTAQSHTQSGQATGPVGTLLSVHAAAEDGGMSADYKAQIIAIILIFIGIANACLASLLTVFVPQICPGNEAGYSPIFKRNLTYTPDHSCTTSENFDFSDPTFTTANKWAVVPTTH